MLRRTMLAVGRALGWALVGMLLVGLALYIRFLRSGPELEPWHRAHLDEEFTAARADEVRTIADYRALETRLLAEVDREVYAETEPEDRLPFNRYFRGSRSDPATWPVDWNRTWEHAPAGPSAAVLLLHGLTDSPYSMHALAETFASQGLHVLALRLPGHGTAPAGLLSFEIEDMQAAVSLAMRDLRRRIGSTSHCSSWRTRYLIRPTQISAQRRAATTNCNRSRTTTTSAPARATWSCSIPSAASSRSRA